MHANGATKGGSQSVRIVTQILLVDAREL
jgi:hypothetical protein